MVEEGLMHVRDAGKAISSIEKRRKQVHVGEAPIYTDAAGPHIIRTDRTRADAWTDEYRAEIT
jgi:hypothetical protein